MRTKNWVLILTANENQTLTCNALLQTTVDGRLYSLLVILVEQLGGWEQAAQNWPQGLEDVVANIGGDDPGVQRVGRHTCPLQPSSWKQCGGIDSEKEEMKD